MKIGIFTDSHYCTLDYKGKTRRPKLSYSKITEALETFKKENIGLVVFIGDLIDTDKDHETDVQNLTTISKLINNFDIEILCAMGNHDGFCFEREEFKKISGFEIAPLHKKYGDTDIILLDANYFKNGEPYMGIHGDWTDTFIPEDELIWLEDELKNCGENTYIFVHQLLDPSIEPLALISDAEKARKIIKASGKVKTVYQGHHHPGGKSVIDSIDYITLPAMCEGEENRFFILNI